MSIATGAAFPDYDFFQKFLSPEILGDENVLQWTFQNMLKTRRGMALYVEHHPLILHLQLWYQCTPYSMMHTYLVGIEQHGYLNPSSSLQAPVCNYRPVHPPILFASAALKGEIVEPCAEHFCPQGDPSPFSRYTLEPALHEFAK
ncbi:hypothetical protein CIRG_05611 [Coccidioides immitis RMSCC 2394]|uniref:Uncharacterized protein n=1 Tax=Coccidioides immitis RMSCC 2394 TaxID=404692 RepID=A0A0J6YE37_COCIT|nr:hypothetical protein CIRG_05611 [Coccidioides immitis RMSCC 2394]